MGVPGVWYVRECFGSLGDGVREGYRPPCGSWELNPGALKEQQVLFTAEPTVWPQWVAFITRESAINTILGKLTAPLPCYTV